VSTDIDRLFKCKIAGHTTTLPKCIASINGQECDVDFVLFKIANQLWIWNAVSAVVDGDVTEVDDIP